MATLLFAEHVNTALKDATAKTLTAVRPLSGEVHVLVAGKGCRPAAETATKLDGVAKVLLADDASYGRAGRGPDRFAGRRLRGDSRARHHHRQEYPAAGPPCST